MPRQSSSGYMRTFTVFGPDGRLRRFPAWSSCDFVKRFCQATQKPGAQTERCRATGFLQHDGKWYCSLHHPPSVERRKQRLA